MKKEELEELIDERLENKKYSDKLAFMCSIAIGILSLLAIICICMTFWHNSKVDYQNEKLEFCKSIYDSDHVVLEQCKDYFVIVESSDKNGIK